MSTSTMMDRMVGVGLALTAVALALVSLISPTSHGAEVNHLHHAQRMHSTMVSAWHPVRGAHTTWRRCDNCGQDVYSSHTLVQWDDDNPYSLVRDCYVATTSTIEEGD